VTSNGSTPRGEAPTGSDYYGHATRRHRGHAGGLPRLRPRQAVVVASARTRATNRPIRRRASSSFSKEVA
jgi:hypothetical protein